MATKDQFVKAYAERSGVTADFLSTFRDARPCVCGDTLCEGWQMVEKEGRNSEAYQNTLYYTQGA